MSPCLGNNKNYGGCDFSQIKFSRIGKYENITNSMEMEIVAYLNR